MKTYSLLLLFVCAALYSSGQQKSYKRGVAYGHHSAADMNTVSKGISWWYNWSTIPDSYIRYSYSDYKVDFTPQAWNAAAISGVSYWASQDKTVKYLLGFNEPNFKSQANMTPTQAAAAWPQLQAVADLNGLKLVSPAVNYCGDCVTENGVTYSNPFTWLDDFFTACIGCRVDYIALHWYGGGNSITGYIDAARKYGKPIWVTEFADWESSGVTADIQKNYLAGTTNFLERDPDVFRYSWFIGRSSGGTTAYPYLDLYGLDGSMSSLGQIYLDIPVYDSSQQFKVPGNIEAEKYYLQKGTFCELTSDVDGFMNIGYTDPGDWLKYKIEVDKSGTYTLTSRYAGTGAGRFDVYVDDIKAATVNTTNTGGWQVWTTAETMVNLTAGSHILKILVVSGGFNLNWINFSEGGIGIYEKQMQPIDADVYPNPVTGNTIRISFKTSCPDEGMIQVTDVSGKIMHCSTFGKLKGNNLDVILENRNTIRPGIYNLSVRSNKKYMNKKIVFF